MLTIVGVFQNETDAFRAVEALKSRGVTDAEINLLVPERRELIKDVPTTDAEPPGMGAVMGGVVGGSIGAGGGFSLAAAAASLSLPGVGPIMAFGVIGASLLGAIGAVGGGLVGEAMEEGVDTGLPIDELYVYEDALRQRRSVVIVRAENADEADAAHDLLIQYGAESIDAAREQWWLGLRDAEQAAYTGEGQDFAKDEPIYRRGFEAAQDLRLRGKSYAESAGLLATQHREVYRQKSFQRGYERGQAYYDRFKKTHPPISGQESGKK